MGRKLKLEGSSLEEDGEESGPNHTQTSGITNISTQAQRLSLGAEDYIKVRRLGLREVGRQTDTGVSGVQSRSSDALARLSEAVSGSPSALCRVPPSPRGIPPQVPLPCGQGDGP